MKPGDKFTLSRRSVLGHAATVSGVGALLQLTGGSAAGQAPGDLRITDMRASQSLSLDGTWRFQLDRDNAGIAQQWSGSDLSGHAELPGCLPAQGIGDEVTVDTGWTGSIFDPAYFEEDRYAPYRDPGNIKVPFWLQPERYYAAAAWYQRDIEIPESWRRQRVVLALERPHWATRVWLDDREIGSRDSLSTPHVYYLGAAVAPGRHRLTIRVDNSLIVDIGVNSHSITDHTQGNWNGIVGQIGLSATAPVWIDRIQVYPDINAKRIRIRGEIRNATGVPVEGTITLLVEAGPGASALEARPRSIPFRAVAESAPIDAGYALGESAQLWDEFTPALYRLRVSMDGQLDGASVGDEQTVTFGLREVAAAGTQFVLNNRKLFLRGTLECAIFPKTGHPPVDVETWKRLIRIAKAHGLNHIRFHSWCPPEAAFVAADELGFYYQVEAASWPNQSTTLGDGKPVDEWLDAETERILETYGNHPSFLLMASSNEPGGEHYGVYLADWLKRYRQRDSRRLFTAGSAWPELPENHFHVSPEPRIQHWSEGLASRINARPPETRTDYREYIGARAVPVVSHEIGQWCVYPNFEEIPKYTGYLQPKNFEIFRDWLNANRMGDQAHDFLIASGKLQALCYKEDIESALRTPGMGGFHLLQLHDFPGQGTALVGVLDPFWDSKGYITAEEFRRFSRATVPLARLDQRVFTNGDTLDADLEVTHFGPEPLRDVGVLWRLVSEGGAAVADGRLASRNIPVDGAVPLGRVSVDLTHVPSPARYRLVVGLEGTDFENDWDVWVYPSRAETSAPPGVTIARELDSDAISTLDSGGTVLLMIPPERVKGDADGPVQLGFSSIFWNTAWTNGQAPHTLGILCDPGHPALESFPTEFHSNWQWWYLVTSAAAMILDEMPPQLRPIVQVVDDWFRARRLGLVFEARAGNGKLLVTSIDLGRGDNPVSRQMLASLLSYVASPRFQPATQLTAAQVSSLIRQNPVAWTLS